MTNGRSSTDSVENAILLALYEAFFGSQMSANLNLVHEQLKVDHTIFWNAVDKMTHARLLESFMMGGSYIIKPRGVLKAEKENIAPTRLVEENQRVRTVILDTLAQVYDERGSYADTPISILSEKAGVEPLVIANNLKVLEDLGYAETVASGTDKITHPGLQAVKEWRARKGQVDEFDRISSMSPQPRGRALQKFLAPVLGKQGWSQKEGVQTSNEEMDIIVFRDREYYLVECKWEKDPIEASIVRELHGKLGNRVGVRGIVMSMSGFSEGAVEQGEYYASTYVMLFFGPTDIRSLVHGTVAFEGLLNHKFQQLITVRRVVFD